MFKNLGTIEVVIMAFVALGLFGTKKLNSLARGLGESSKEFKKVKKEYDTALKNDPLKKDEAKMAEKEKEATRS